MHSKTAPPTAHPAFTPSPRRNPSAKAWTLPRARNTPATAAPASSAGTASRRSSVRASNAGRANSETVCSEESMTVSYLARCGSTLFYTPARASNVTSVIGPPPLPQAKPRYARLMKGDRVEIVVAADDGSRTYEILATRDGRRGEITPGRGIVEVAEVTRTGEPVRTARFMASRVLALVEHPASEARSTRELSDDTS